MDQTSLQRQRELLAQASEIYLEAADKICKSWNGTRNPDRSQQLEKFREDIQNNVRMQIDLENRSEICQQILSAINEDQDIDIENVLEEEMAKKEPSEEDVQDAEASRKLESIIAAFEIPEDQLKNRHCGHLYNKKSILDMIEKDQNVGQLRCPRKMCANTERTLTRADLLPEEKVVRRRSSPPMVTSTKSTRG